MVKELLSIGLAVTCLTSAYMTDLGNRPMAEYRYTVKGGDTIWGVAEKFAEPGDDIRMLVYNIEKDSGIKKNTYLQPGQELVIRVPVKERDAKE